MKVVKPLFAALSLAAFAIASAYADDAKKEKSDTQASSAAGATASKKGSFSSLDKDNDGSVSRMEAAADADAKSSFEQKDKNKDGKLSRSEYEGGASAAVGGSSSEKKDDKASKQSK